MRRLGSLGSLVALLALVAALCAAGGRAANWPDPRLDAVATAVAGKAVAVWCETSEQTWAGSFGSGGDPYGITFPGQSDTVYLSPVVCESLHALLSAGYRVVGPYWGSVAIQVLLHEAVHQRGVIDEAATDCTALSLLKQYAVSAFGVTATVVVRRQVHVAHQMRVGRRIVRWTTTRLVSQTLPNPDLELLYQWDLRWHRSLPSQYQGAC